MEKAKNEMRTCEQGEKWSLNQVRRCLDTINMETFERVYCLIFTGKFKQGSLSPLGFSVMVFVFVFPFPECKQDVN